MIWTMTVLLAAAAAVQSLIYPEIGNFAGAKDYAVDDFGSRKKRAQINVTILVIPGDHDPACPIGNWYALSRKIPNLQLIMLGQTGHGPQSQYPALTVQYIRNFVNHAPL